MPHDEATCPMCCALVEECVRNALVLVPFDATKERWLVVRLQDQVGVTDTHVVGYRAWLVGKIVRAGDLRKCLTYLCAQLPRLSPVVAAHSAWRAKQDGVDL